MPQSISRSMPGRSQPPGTGFGAILGAALQVVVLFVLSRATGIVRDVIIVAQFDLSPQLDAYQAAFRIPDMIFEVVAGGALGSAFIPTFTRYLQHRSEHAAWRLFSQTLNAVTLIVILLAAAGILLAPWLIRSVLAPGFAPDQQRLVADLMRWLLLGTVIYGASGLCMAALNVKRHFFLPALAPVLRNLAIVAGALWLTDVWGIYALAAGAVAGSAVHLLVQLPELVRRGLRYRPVLRWRDPGLIHIVGLVLPRMLGLLFIHLNLVVNTNLISRLAPGSVSAFEYGFRLMLLPVSLCGQALAIAAFPTFSAQAEAGAFREIQETFARLLRLVVFLALPAAVGLYLLRIPLIQVLYQRGSFTEDSTQMVAHALQFFLLGLPAYAVVEVAVRAFYAFHDTRTPVVAGVLIVLLNIGLSIWWIRHLDFGGPALANSVATTAEMILLLAWLRRRMPALTWRCLLRDMWQAPAAALVMGILLWQILQWGGRFWWLQAEANAHYWQLAAGIPAALVSYFVLNIILGNRDWRFLLKRTVSA